VSSKIHQKFPSVFGKHVVTHNFLDKQQSRLYDFGMCFTIVVFTPCKICLLFKGNFWWIFKALVQALILAMPWTKGFTLSTYYLINFGSPLFVDQLCSIDKIKGF
jgi:hypothetical protein